MHRAVLALLFVAASIRAVPIGIDIGAEWLKVASVQQGGIDIVLNEQSSRKTPSYLGFRNDERFFGDDAQNLAPRFPSQMFTFLSLLLGQPYDNEELLTLYNKKLLLTSDLGEVAGRGTILLKAGGNDTYTVEELWSMWFTRLKKYAESYTQQTVSECVIAVPTAFNTRQRQAVLDSAKLSNLNVISLIDHTTAAALQYGVQNRGFPNGKKIILVDYGASTLEVGVFAFDPLPNITSKKKSGDVLGGLNPLSVVGDQYNGGRQMDFLLAESIAKQFKDKRKVDLLSLDDSNARKAKVKLMRSAQKAKEVLSANKEAQLVVEGIWEETDFPFTLTRAAFEDLISPLVERAINVVKEAVQRSGLQLSEIDSLELMGGNTRVPLFQEKLQQYFGRPLGRSLNTDEAISYGAAFQAARRSGSVRVRSFALNLVSPVNISFQLSSTPEVPNPAPRDLFVHAPLPSRKVVHIQRTEPFNLTVFKRVTNLETGEELLQPIDMFKFENVKDRFTVLGAFKLRNETEEEDTVNATAAADTNGTVAAPRPKPKPTVEIKFSITESGLVFLDSAHAKYNGSSRSITPQVEFILTPLPMNKEAEHASNAVLVRLNRREDEKRKIAEAKNALESLMIATRYDDFLQNDNYKRYFEKDTEEKVNKLIEEIDEWLQGEGSDATAREYKSKQTQLTNLLQPIKDKHEESLESARRKLDEKRKKKVNTTAADTNATESTEQAADKEEIEKEKKEEAPQAEGDEAQADEATGEEAEADTEKEAEKEGEEAEKEEDEL